MPAIVRKACAGVAAKNTAKPGQFGCTGCHLSGKPCRSFSNRHPPGRPAPSIALH